MPDYTKRKVMYENLNLQLAGFKSENLSLFVATYLFN